MVDTQHQRDPTIARPLRKSKTPLAFLCPLIIRLSLALLLPQTAFQPDEFYQSLEPAHYLVFGYGHLTWEWRDLPRSISSFKVEEGKWAEWYDRVVVGGRMRGWIWPGVFALVYKGLALLDLDERFLVVAPRVVGAVIAASTDYTTYRLGIKFLGPGAGAGALFLSLTSLFNAHILPRALSTSPETLLTALALLYFPFPATDAPSSIAVGKDGLVASPNMTKLSALGLGKKDNSADENSKVRDCGHGDVHRVKDVGEMDYVMMDRMEPSADCDELVESLPLSAALATLAICIRPTTIPLWLYLGSEYLARAAASSGLIQALADTSRAVCTAFAVLAASTSLDYLITGRLYFPILTFIHYNFFTGLSATFGATSSLYHLTQSLPIILFPIWYWFAQGFFSALLPSSILPSRLRTLDHPAPLRTLSRAVAFAITILSLSPHSEWRFLHPFLPPLLLFALPPLFRSYTPIMGAAYRLSTCFRQYLRINKRPFYLILCAPVIPFLYLNISHGRAQVQVMDLLRGGRMGEVTGVVVLMPCHSTPWMSHLHRDVPAWFLTCEPPIGVDQAVHHTPESIFYNSPISYLETVFPYPPSPLHQIFSAEPDPTEKGGPVLPSHILLFGCLLDAEDENGTSVRNVLDERGYEEVWSGWNGFDWAQDEEKRRGGVKVWGLRI